MCVDAKHGTPMGMWHQIVPVFFALTHRSRPGLECHATKTAIPIFLCPPRLHHSFETKSDSEYVSSVFDADFPREELFRLLTF